MSGCAASIIRAVAVAAVACLMLFAAEWMVLRGDATDIRVLGVILMFLTGYFLGYIFAALEASDA